MMLHQAYMDEVIPKNPTLGVKRLAQGMTDVDPFTIEEREEIIGGFRRYAPHYVNYVICGFWTGWRPNEACALKWPRVDFQHGKILIREGRVLGHDRHPQVRGQPAGHGYVAAGAREALAAQKALSWLLGGYVFLDGKQQPVNQELFRHEGLGAGIKALRGALPAALPDAAYLCDAGHLGRGEHQLGGPDVGA